MTFNMKKYYSKILASLLGVAIAMPAMAVDEPVETWTSLGKGKFRESFMHAFYQIASYPEVDVEIQECDQAPGRYRIVDPYKDYPNFIGTPGCRPGKTGYIYVNAEDPVHVYIETSQTGYIAGEGQELIVGSIADDYYNVRYGDWKKADAEGLCGTLKYGAVTFPAKAVLLASLWEYEYPWTDDILWRQCNSDGMFRMTLPGAPNLDITHSFFGINDEHTQLNFEVTLGSSIEKALVALVPGTATEKEISEVADGTINSTEITKSGEIVFPYTADGLFTLVVVPYYEGKAAIDKTYTAGHEFAYDESEWRKAGQAHYYEAIISSNEMRQSGFVISPYDYMVDVEENVNKPGYIRLVNAYTANYPLASAYHADTSRNYYIYIDATDPARVFIEYTPTIGIDFGYGTMSIWSKVSRYRGEGRSEEAIAELGFYGNFNNNEITFPKEALDLRFTNVTETWYWANLNGNFSLKFNEGQIRGGQTGIEGVAIDDDSNAPEQYYTIDGKAVGGDNLRPGLYIVRKGSKTYKVIK